MTTRMPKERIDEIVQNLRRGWTLPDALRDELIAEVQRAQDLEDRLTADLQAVKLRQHDGRALRLACNIIGDALIEDCRMSVWRSDAFVELGENRGQLCDMDPGERSASLVASFREVARKESEVRIAGQVCTNCGGHRMGAESIKCCPVCNTPYETDEGKKETMSEEKKFKAGEIVRLNSGGPMMTIGTPGESSSSCYWFDGVKAKALGFPTSALRRVEADEIEAERTVLFAESDKAKANAARLELLFKEIQTTAIPSVVPPIVEYFKARAVVERAKGEPLQLANAFKEAFFGLDESARNALVEGVLDSEAGAKFFEAMMATG